MRLLKHLATFVATVTVAGGCTTSHVTDHDPSPSAIISDTGTVTVNHRTVKVADLASELKSAGYRKSSEVVIQIPDSPDRLVMRQISSELAKNGFSRTIFIKKRKASASVSERN